MCIAHEPIRRDSILKPVYEFVPNAGQWHPAIRYKTDIPFGNLLLESDALHYLLVHPKDYNRMSKWQHDNPTKTNDEIPRMHSVRMRFLGMEYAPQLQSAQLQKHYYNYYLGNDQTKWASELYPSAQVNYENVYPDVDLEIVGQSGLKYQWVIQNPTPEKLAKIQVSIEGANSISLENGKIIIYTSAGNITDNHLYVYQQIGDAVVELNARYVLIDSVLGYEVLSSINPNYPLIIDPELIFSTYSGSTGDNFGYTATFDSKANLYAGGMVKVIPGLNETYPVTSGAFDVSYNGGSGGFPCDVSISKYDSAGTRLLWASYLGGSHNEYPHSLVVDRNDDLIILGTTYSANFPVDSLSYDNTLGGGADIYVAKLSEDGASLLGSTYIGGSMDDGLNQNADLQNFYADDFRGDIITDDDNHIFVATTTFSDDIPIINAIQSVKASAYDGYLFELSSNLKKLEWGTFLGGNGSDAFYSIKLDQGDNIYIGGGTTSTDLPATDASIGPLHIGGVDGVLAILSKKNKQLKRLSYWGTENYDQIYFIDRDVEGRIYATGQTAGAITKTPNVYGESNKGQFLFRIDTLLQTQDFVTTFGNTDKTPNLAPSAFLVDVCGHIYFSGWGSSKSSLGSGSTNNMETTSDAVQKKTDDNDFYILVLGRDAKNILYATYFGGDSTADHVDGGTSRFDKRGVMYQSVCSSCPADDDLAVITRGISDFPTTSGAAFETNPSVRCSNASFKIDLQIRSAVISDFVAAPTIGCAPLGVQFTSTSVLGDSFHWDFGDGDTSTLLNPFHTFMESGNYMVTLTVIDSATCNILSTYKRQIEVIANANAAFDVSFNACENKMSLENTSTNGFEYVWDFGDGTTSTKRDPEYAYNAVGAYTISLRVNPGTLCEDTVSKRLDILEDATPSIKLYNVFTPNGDGTNDCFKFDLENRECTDYKLQIFNRWGERLFETSDPRVCWDGILPDDRHLAPEGTYFYIVNVGKNSEPISGIVELMK
jgi:gliding motility-associated-like protein